jgi:small subunit ribosomal protein S8
VIGPTYLPLHRAGPGSALGHGRGRTKQPSLTFSAFRTRFKSNRNVDIVFFLALSGTNPGQFLIQSISLAKRRERSASVQTSCIRTMPQLHHVCSHIQNASKARQAITSIPITRLNFRLALAFKAAGFLSSVQPGDYSGPDPEGRVVPVTPANVSSRRLWLGLKYVDNERVITKCELMSRGNRRVYVNLREIEEMIKGRRAQSIRGLSLGECMFIGTDRGVFEARDAIRRRLGGEALCRVS